LNDLVSSRWKGKIGIAKPLFGTTATHAACLFATWGEEKARRFFKDLKANDVQVLSGNKQVATAVGTGQIAFGLTDTDDAMGEVEAGSPVAIVYPDRQPDQLGTLFVPNTIALIKDAPHPQAAARLANLILSPEVEARLADGPSAQIPLLRSTKKPARVETPASVHPMEVDFQKAAQLWDQVAAFLTAEFES
jgi:iron(III) transport system substrate-binding protein